MSSILPVWPSSVQPVASIAEILVYVASCSPNKTLTSIHLSFLPSTLSFTQSTKVIFTKCQSGHITYFFKANEAGASTFGIQSRPFAWPVNPGEITLPRSRPARATRPSFRLHPWAPEAPGRPQRLPLSEPLPGPPWSLCFSLSRASV